MEILGYSLQTIYLFGLIIGGSLTLLYILLSDILEGLFEFIPDGYFNPTLVLSFFTFVSSTGYLFEKFIALNSLLILLISLVLSFTLVTLLNVFVLIPLSSAEASLAYTETDLKGRIGKVIISIPEAGFGEVVLNGIGGMISKSAISFDHEYIGEGTKVVVIDIEKGVLHVSPHETLFELSD